MDYFYTNFHQKDCLGVIACWDEVIQEEALKSDINLTEYRIFAANAQ